MADPVYNKDNKSVWKGETDMKSAAKETERLFIAVKLPEEIGRVLGQECAEMSERLKFAKWTHPLDYHITLQFLGDTRKEQIPALLEALKGISGKHAPFKLQLKEWGTFGPGSAPRVLWAGVSGELEKLQGLQQSVVSATAPLGFKAEERPYAPHLTLARKYRDEQPFSLSRLGNLRVQKPASENNCSENDWTVEGSVVYATRMHAIPMYEIIENLTFF